MEYIYVLKLENKKWYVGKTENVAKRYIQHLNGNGSTWTSKYKPVKLYSQQQMKTDHDENNITKDLMKKYGIANVRGGAYTHVVLSDAVKETLEHELLGVSDSCYKCGEKGHFARNCDAEIVWECNYCEAQYEDKSECEKHERFCKKSNQTTYGSCYRCGRDGHWSPDCYAKYHSDGYKL